MRSGQLDHAFLQRRHCGVAHFNGQVATRHHDAVAGAQDFFQIWNGFGTFYFCNQSRFMSVGRSCNVTQLARHFHIRGIFWKADSNIISLKAHGCLDVVHVFCSQGQRRQASALFVDALVV